MGSTSPPAGVSYRVTERLAEQFHDLVVALAEAMPGCRIADVGGGANPLLPPATIEALGLRYTVLDIDPVELAKAPAGYRTELCDITAPRADLGEFDLIVSRMLAEHIADAAAFHRGVRSLLAPGGRAVHLVPTLFALPFVVNRVLPERLASAALAVVRPRDRVQHRKFPAYYRWCHGPTRRQRDRLTTAGYEIEGYIGLFGHGYYRRVPGLRTVHRYATGMIARRPLAAWTSYAIVVLRRR